MGTATATARPKELENPATIESRASEVVGGSGWYPLVPSSVSRVLFSRSQSAAFQFSARGSGEPVGTTANSVMMARWSL